MKNIALFSTVTISRTLPEVLLDILPYIFSKIST